MAILIWTHCFSLFCIITLPTKLVCVCVCVCVFTIDLRLVKHLKIQDRLPSDVPHLMTVHQTSPTKTTDHSRLKH